MTQTTVRTTSLDDAPLVPTVPRPRDTEPQTPSDAPLAAATSPAPVEPAPADPAPADLAPAVPVEELGRRRARRSRRARP